METRIQKLEREVAENRATLVGINGQGGLIQRLETIAARTHKLSNDVAVVQTGARLLQEDVATLVDAMRGRK